MRFLWSLLLLLVLTQGQAAEKSLFWQLESPTGKVSYLFGTMHTDDQRVTDFSPRVMQALKSVDTFMLEVADAPKPAWLRLPQGDLKQYQYSTELYQIDPLEYQHALQLETA